MSKLVLFTSGSTKEAKEVIHDWDYIHSRMDVSIKELEMTKDDIVLNVLPFNVIGYHSIMAGPATKVGATVIHMNFDPYAYIRMFNKYRPTLTVLIPRHVELLQQTKGFDSLDMSCLRYMVTGSQNIEQSMIDLLLSKGVQTIGNWYGSTEFPPPVFISHNGTVFDMDNTYGYNVTFDQKGECYVDGIATGDVFNLGTKEFSHRLQNATNNTWKS
jgi:acyl-coenzyme A synthetase/AMP-(fatty) acid ligase